MKEHRAGFQLVSLTDATRTTVRIFLSALKLFYRIMRVQDRYQHTKPLAWMGPSAVLAEVELRMRRSLKSPDFHRCRPSAAVVLPRKKRLSDSYSQALWGESPDSLRSSMTPRSPPGFWMAAARLDGGCNQSALPAFSLNPDVAFRKWSG